MSYYATQNASGSYDIFSDGAKISTGSAAVLGNYGLAENNLGSPTKAAPAPTPAPSPAPQAAPVSSPAPQPDVNAGRTPVTLGNGSTVFYDKSGQAFDSTGALVPTATISQSTIGHPVTPPATTGAPTLPQAQAPSIADQFNTSLSATLAAQQQQLTDTLKAATESFQTRIDALDKQNQELQQLQDNGMLSENTTIQQETAAKQAALDQEKQQFQDNYQARQQLVGQLQTLLTTGQSVIEQMKGTTGLASIMNPRLSQTMTDVQAQAGVITAALAAYDTQIGLAQSQLKSATDAISSIYGDQISYWQNVVSFYADQEKTNNAKIASLTSDQKAYIDAQIKQLQENVNQTQQTASAISKAMLDPQTALAYAKAGVSLTDTPEQISAKLATYEQAQQNVWGDPFKLGGDYVQRNKITGETRTVVSNIAGAAGGTASERQAAQLQSYSAAFVPGATLKDGTPIIDSNGYINPSAWKQAIADYSGSRDDFIKKYGYLIYTPNFSKYGLTAPEQKLITG